MTDFGFPASELPAFVATDTTGTESLTGRFTSAESALAFVRAGKATVTLVSVKTGVRFTYRATAKDDCIFVGLLNGPDNTSDYKYLGRIARGIFWAGRKSPRPGDISPDAPSARGFDWAWRHLVKGELPESLEIWHEGRCGRCSRKLTVPASIASGFGPECAGRM